MLQVHTLPAPEHLARDFGYPSEESSKPVYYVEQNGEPFTFEPAAGDAETR